MVDLYVVLSYRCILFQAGCFTYVRCNDIYEADGEFGTRQNE